jgi:hypothetical protein
MLEGRSEDLNRRHIKRGAKEDCWLIGHACSDLGLKQFRSARSGMRCW